MNHPCPDCGFSFRNIRCSCTGNEEITQIRKRFAKLKAVAAMEKYVRDRNNVNYKAVVSAGCNPNEKTSNQPVHLICGQG